MSQLPWGFPASFCGLLRMIETLNLTPQYISKPESRICSGSEE